jgi:uncharacterized protein YdhG (YjbR/CyaY superfamily)
VESSTPAKSIDDYLKGFDPPTREVLEELRAVIKAAAPGAVERISYRMPTFDIRGKHVVFFAGYKQHVGFYPNPSAIEAFKEELRPYNTSKGTVQFPLDEPLPIDLIRRMVEFRVAEVHAGKGYR